MFEYFLIFDYIITVFYFLNFNLIDINYFLYCYFIGLPVELKVINYYIFITGFLGLNLLIKNTVSLYYLKLISFVQVHLLFRILNYFLFHWAFSFNFFLLKIF